MTKICAGCGITLQTEKETEKGFIPLKKYENANYCMRCFKMTHYGTITEDSLSYNNNELIKKINEKNIHTIFLIDFLNITNEVLELFKNITNEKTLVINKCEMLPKFLKKEKLIKLIKEEFEIYNKIILKGHNGSKEFELIYDYLKNNNIKKCLFVGMSNVGKSTLINDLIKLTKSENPKLTVNKKENTTLDFLSIDMKDFTIIDTPGFILEDYLNIPKSKKIKSFIFQMKENEILNLTQDFFLQCEKRVNINYFTNYLYEKNIKKNFKEVENLETKLKIPANYDLVIKGLGIITFKEETVIKTNIEKKYLTIKSSMFRR